MKKLLILALVSGQAIGAAPAAAAELIEDRAEHRQQMGAFGGMRVRVPLDGNAGQRQVRAGLMMAPALHGRSSDGASRLWIGEGIELGVTGREPVRLTLAGVPVGRLGAQEEDEEEGDGPSTIGWIAIGVGALLVGLVAAVVVCAEDSDCIPSE